MYVSLTDPLSPPELQSEEPLGQLLTPDRRPRRSGAFAMLLASSLCGALAGGAVGYAAASQRSTGASSAPGAIDVPAIVASSGPIYEFPMVDRDPLPQWTFGRATLMGDAAHPMYPIGSNGATQGIIDARVFAWHLARSTSVEEALRLYEADRREATARIVLMNSQQGPDRVLDLAAERLEGGSGALVDLLPMEEREAVAQSYKKTAGFDPATLNARMSFSIL